MVLECSEVVGMNSLEKGGSLFRPKDFGVFRLDNQRRGFLDLLTFTAPLLIGSDQRPLFCCFFKQEHLSLWKQRVYRENEQHIFKATAARENIEGARRFFYTWETKVSGRSLLNRLWRSSSGQGYMNDAMRRGGSRTSSPSPPESLPPFTRMHAPLTIYCNLMTLLYVAWLVQGLQSALAEVKGVKVTIRPIGLPPRTYSTFRSFPCRARLHS